MKKIICLMMCAIFALFAFSCSDEGGTLDTPSVTISEAGIASWSVVEGATGYEYKINDREAVRVDASITAITLVAGESLVVRALGDGESYFDSEWSQSVKNNSLVKLPKPTLETTTIGSQIIISWEKDARASSYKFRLNDGAETEIEVTQYLINATDTFRLQAVGDETTYASSDWAIIAPSPTH